MMSLMVVSMRGFFIAVRTAGWMSSSCLIFPEIIDETVAGCCWLEDDVGKQLGLLVGMCVGISWLPTVCVGAGNRMLMR